jgi:Tfp pilus assembly protein PilV
VRVRHASRLQRGISLIEAVVALGVMAFGMLGVVGLQVTLRSNGDIAKQRAEAVRIAQQAVENWRAIGAIENTAGVVDYQELEPDDGPTNVVGINATYSTTRTVWTSGSPPMKTLAVAVTWSDRAGEVQTVQLNSVIAGVAPELAGSLAVPPSGGPSRQPKGRNPGIPYTATELGGGYSAFKPPQGAGGTVVWVFNNLTGVLQTCAILDLLQPLTAGNIVGCVGRAQLLSGYVNFADDSAQATAAEALAPTGAAFAVEVTVMRTLPAPLTVATGSGCFTEPPLAGVPYLAYYCAVPVSADLADPPIWSGYSIVTSASLPVAPVVGEKSTCRYTTERSDNAIANYKHPRAYSAVGEPLANQNFLVVKVVTNDASDCPDGAPLPTGTTTFPQPQTPP